MRGCVCSVSLNGHIQMLQSDPSRSVYPRPIPFWKDHNTDNQEPPLSSKLCYFISSPQNCYTRIPCSRIQNPTKSGIFAACNCVQWVLSSVLQVEGHFSRDQESINGAAHLTNSMEEAGVDGALIVQPINHKFDHSLVTSVLKKYPSKFVGCLLANPAEDGNGIKQLEDLILKDGYRAVRFNPYIWPSGQKMTNEVGKAMFSKAGELGVPVGFMCLKGINIHFSEIEELCSEFPLTPVIIDHVGFCKPPENNEENEAFSDLLKLSKFPQVYVKFSALFRVTRKPHPYEDTSYLLSHVLSSYGSKRVMWGSDFPYVVPECGYKGGKEAVSHVANLVGLPSSDLEWIMGKTVMQLFPNSWNAA